MNIKDAGNCLYTEIDSLALGGFIKSYEHEISVPKVSINLYKNVPDPQVIDDEFNNSSSSEVLLVRVASLEFGLAQAKVLYEGLQEAIAQLEIKS